MKIIPSFNQGDNRVHSRKDKKITDRTKASSFADVLENSISREYDESVEELLNDLKEKEKRFLDQETLADLNEYRNTVQKILKMVAESGFETKTVTSRRLSQSREYFLVHQIDEKLKQLALSLTSPGSRSFNLLKQCEEIRGLIFDLVK